MLVIQRPSVEAIGDDHPTRQRFAVGPLEPGFGHTIGNSLRRTLLSSIPGAAITTVKFDGVEHEFTVIKGMTEDITEFIMNLKDVVVVSRSDEPVVVRIDVKGPMVLTAADIPTTADIDILNPSLHLATLNAGAQLALDITFERGRGYLSTDRDAESRIIGVIPIDSIFSPVRRVMFEVEPTRVAQSTNYDRLVLDIETDGSISPRESLASASATLRSLVDLIATLSEEPQSLELSEPMGANVGVPDLDLPIEDLDLSERPRNCLKRGQINTIGELLLKSTDDLLNITNFGQKSLDEIIQKLDERGRGYLSTDRDAESRIIGVIPIDAIFSPVRRVMFEVEPTRVAQSTNYDRLVIDIETDGSISPRESLASASATLRSLVDLIATLSEEPQSLELSEPMGANVGVPDLDLPIEDLDLSERPRNCLKRGQINTIGELLLKSIDDLLNITNFGQKSLDEIIQKLDERGLTLRA